MAYLFIAALFVAVCGYLLGSNMTAIRIAGKKSVDIRECGSGNAGSTNILRTFGWKWGLLCLFSDCAKGAIAALIGHFVALAGSKLGLFSEGFNSLFMCEGLLGAMLGHLLPIFHQFRGGKCVAVAIGGMLLIAPVELAIGLAVGVILILITKMVSVGSVTGAVIAGTLTVIANPRDTYLVLFSITLALVIILTHIPNIQRILSGNERRLGSIAWEGKEKGK